jgi:Mg/Co/Ni transporter MgtE
LLRDHVLNKKVIDIKEREVEVVFDIRLFMRNDKLYVSDVDFSRHALFRRMDLEPLADLIYGPEEAKEKLVSWTHVQPLTNVSSFGGDIKLDVLKEKLLQLRPVDIATILEEMEHENSVTILNRMDTHTASNILEEIGPNVQRELIASLNKKKVIKLLDVMTPGQAADILSVLPIAERESILKSLHKLDSESATKIRSILEQHEEDIINYATPNFIKVAPDEIVEDVQKKYYIISKDKDVMMYLYVVDKEDRLLGVIDIKELLRGRAEARLEEIMVRNVIALNPQSTLRDASLIFSKYGFRAIPITDKNKVVGVVPSRDVMNLKHLFID